MENELLKIIPTLFEINMVDDKTGHNIFQKIEKILQFNQAYIFYTNPENIQLKYLYKKSEYNNIGQVFDINDQVKQFIFDKRGMICDKTSNFINNINLKISEYNSFLISKISIKSTVFGLIVLAKNEENYYKHSDLQILNAISSIIAYILKDIELSNVFKIQLKALKDGIIEKNEAYKTIKEQNEKILEADKIKNEFLANISHELRTPLNSILGFSDILSAKLYGDLNNKQEEYINDIKVSATHLLGMINGILDMSKIEANAMKIVKSNFPISRAIEEVINITAPLAQKKNISFNKILNQDFEIFADYQKIQQILYNLISNAIKFSPENDSIDVLITRNEKVFKIAIHDNGIGIDEKYHGKIFAKFVQLDNAYTKKESSTGLGLTITKELIELHNGKISVISEVNNGSTFIVEIPF